MTNDDVLIRAERVGKKFCRDLKKSLWYGAQDIVDELLCRDSASRPLRKQEFWANQDISFELRRGQRLGLIGCNGAGKTTLLKLLTGLIKPDRGRMTVRGRVGGLIALGAGFNPILTGRENVYINAAVLGFNKRQIDGMFDAIVDFSGIEEFIDSPVQSYSSGMQVRLGFAVASVMKPDVLLVDEVLAVGDEQFRAKCFNRLGELQRDGVAFVLVSHNLHQIQRFCDTVMLLDHGVVVELGDPETAIASFRRIMNQNGTPADSDSDPVGSGRVRFTNVSTVNASGESTANFGSNEPLQLRVDYEAAEACQGARFDLSAYAGADSRLFFQTSSGHQGIPMDIPAGRGQIRVMFDYLAANEAVLNVCFSLWNSDYTELFDWRRGIEVRSAGCTLSSGLVDVPVRFELLQST